MHNPPHLKDKGNTIRSGMIQVVLIPFPILRHMQRGGLQLILDNSFSVILYRISTGISTSFKYIILFFNSCVINLGLNTTVCPDFSILILLRKIGEGVLPGVTPGVVHYIIRGKLDRHDFLSAFIRSHARQAGPLLCCLVIGAEAAFPWNILPSIATVIGSLQHNRNASGAKTVLVVAVHPVFTDIVGRTKAVGQHGQREVSGRSYGSRDRPIGLSVTYHRCFRYAINIRHAIRGVAFQIVDGILPIIIITINRFLP